MGKIIKLDRNRRYGTVFGDEVDNPERPRKFYQDGMYFDGAGVAIEGSELPVHKPPPSNDPVAVVEQPEEDDRSEIIKLLQTKSVPALKKMANIIHDETGAALPESGVGVKARLVSYIAENAE